MPGLEEVKKYYYLHVTIHGWVNTIIVMYTKEYNTDYRTVRNIIL